MPPHNSYNLWSLIKKAATADLHRREPNAAGSHSGCIRAGALSLPARRAGHPSAEASLELEGLPPQEVHGPGKCGHVAFHGRRKNTRCLSLRSRWLRSLFRQCYAFRQSCVFFHVRPEALLCCLDAGLSLSSACSSMCARRRSSAASMVCWALYSRAPEFEACPRASGCVPEARGRY